MSRRHHRRLHPHIRRTQRPRVEPLEERRMLAQGFQLLKDINPISDGSAPDNAVATGGFVYFDAESATHGRELWKSDGTAAGTVLVRDINPGNEHGIPAAHGEMTSAEDGTLYFVADDGVSGAELWKSDGSEAGTVRVSDLRAGSESSSPGNLAVVNGILFFTADDGVSGTELWKSDGTEAGTTRVKDIHPGGYGAYPSELTRVGGTLFFRATDSSGGTELWKSDGTEAGTVRVKDIIPGGFSSYPGELTNVSGTLYFRAADSVGYYGSYNDELWKSDGTETGTARVKDIYPGDYGSYLRELTNVGGTLFFQATDSAYDAELWTSDGTEAGTVRVKDINPGDYGSDPRGLANVSGTLYFAIRKGLYGELWKSDGTDSGTVRVKGFGTVFSTDFTTNPAKLTNVDGTLFFSANDGTSGYELWKTDGTEAGTVLVRDIRSGYGPLTGSRAEPFTNLGGKLFFRADDGISGFELWSSDGSESGTFRVKDISDRTDNAYPKYFVPAGDALFFDANDGLSGVELWKTDGTEAGTQLVKDIRPGILNGTNAVFRTELDGTLLLNANDGTGRELWKSDGTEEGTQIVKSIFRDPNPAWLTNVDGTVFFSARDLLATGRELWKTDGTESGTVLVKDIRPGAPNSSSSPVLLTNVNGTLFFRANDGFTGEDLWKSDGTAEGTVLVKDIAPGGSGNPESFTNVGGTLYFLATESASGQELWKSDGTESGTVLVKDINPGPTWSQGNYLTDVDGTLFFTATDGSSGFELWKSDGTESGTVMVKDIRPGTTGSDPSRLVNVDGTLYFVADDGIAGAELWKSDGTEAGTVLVKDITPTGGYPTYPPQYLTNVNGTLYFQANDGVAGAELWKSDGTTSGTVLAHDFTGDGGSSAPGRMTWFNGRLFVVATTEEHGRELWVSVNTGGDFNGDGLFDEADIDALVATIAAGTNETEFDLTGDGLVDLDDRDQWLATAGEQNLGVGRAFLRGDANLDGLVDVSDFNRWNANKFTAIAAWSAGDFTANGGCFVPRTSHYTGNIHGHELAWGNDGLWVVNTLFSCLCTLHEDYSFVPRWRPPFISELVDQDRCHLNGLAVEHGAPRFVTVLAASDEPAGWRPTKATSGRVLDVPSGETILDGLAMPHSPRVVDGRLWVLDSGNGRLGYVDSPAGKYVTVEQLPGYTRGLAFAGQFAFVGLSKIRETAVFGGVPIAKQKDALCCGVGVVDLLTGRTVAVFQFFTGVTEVFAVDVLPEVLSPVIAGSTVDEHERDVWIVPPPAEPSPGVSPRLPLFAGPQPSPNRIPQGTVHQPMSDADLAALAARYHAEGRLADAATCYQKAIAVAVRPAPLLVNLGNVYQEQDDQVRALDCYTQAVESDPTSVPGLQNLGYLLFNRGEPEKAHGVYDRLRRIDPSPLNRLLSASVLPVIYDSDAAIEDWRERQIAALEGLVKRQQHVDAGSGLIPTAFFWAYQGASNRLVMSLRGQIISGACHHPPRQSHASAGRPGHATDRRIRVGFLSAYFRNHTIARLNLGRIERLDRSLFHVTVASAAARGDEATARFQRAADRFVVLPRDVRAARQLLCEQNLDVLIFADVGMDALTSTLAFSRMAPVQCVTWGHPDTTGSPCMDYFLSSELLETPDADAHYTEQLVRLRQLGIYYFKPQRNGPPRDRTNFGLSDRKHVYLCPQTLFKFHPDFDQLLAEILEADSNGELVLVEGRVPAWTEQLKRRFHRSLPDAHNRVRFLPAQPHDDFLALLGAADVILDPLHFGGGNTTYEALAMGTPVITVPGPFLRSRITAALYRKMEFADLVAEDRRDYVRLGVLTATDADFRAAVRRKILETNHVLFEDDDEVRAMEEWLIGAVHQ